MPTMTSVLKGRAVRAQRTPNSALTESEERAAKLAAAGFSNKEIGQQIGIAESTVKKHVSAALVKHGLTSRVELIFLYGDLCDDCRARLTKYMKK